MITDSFVNMLLGTPKDRMQQDVSDAMARYFTYRTINDGVDKFLGVRNDDPNSDLERQSLELDVAMKRHALGLPNDTREFNQEVNSPTNRILAGLGIRGADALQSAAAAAKSSPSSAALPWLLGGGPEGVATHGVPELGSGGLSLFGILRRANRGPATVIRRSGRIP